MKLDTHHPPDSGLAVLKQAPQQQEAPAPRPEAPKFSDITNRVRWEAEQRRRETEEQLRRSAGQVGPNERAYAVAPDDWANVTIDSPTRGVVTGVKVRPVNSKKKAR